MNISSFFVEVNEIVEHRGSGSAWKLSRLRRLQHDPGPKHKKGLLYDFW